MKIKMQKINIIIPKGASIEFESSILDIKGAVILERTESDNNNYNYLCAIPKDYILNAVKTANTVEENYVTNRIIMNFIWGVVMLSGFLTIMKIIENIISLT